MKTIEFKAWCPRCGEVKRASIMYLPGKCRNCPDETSLVSCVKCDSELLDYEGGSPVEARVIIAEIAALEADYRRDCKKDEAFDKQI